MELEGNLVNVGDLLDMMPEFNVKFYVCHAFMPLFSIAKEELIEGAEMKGSSYLGELLLAGYSFSNGDVAATRPQAGHIERHAKGRRVHSLRPIFFPHINSLSIYYPVFNTQMSSRKT